MTTDVPENGDRSWEMRAAKYDKLYWTKDDAYVRGIILAADLDRSPIVLDVGTGTGTMARAVQGLVRHVVGADMSAAMLGEGDWTGISVVRWNVAELRRRSRRARSPSRRTRERCGPSSSSSMRTE
jgi:SAM-dependent methyltransferase